MILVLLVTRIRTVLALALKVINIHIIIETTLHYIYLAVSVFYNITTSSFCKAVFC